MEFDLVTIGDPAIDTFLKIHDAHLALRVNPKETELCIDYADKIPVDELHHSIGGGCVNAAVAAARLGLRTAVYAVTGADQEGRSLVCDMQGEGIDTSLIEIDRRHTTNASTAIVFRGERTLLVWHQPRVYHLPQLPEATWIYAGSVGPGGPAVNRLHEALLRQLEHRPYRLAFCPGSHQLRMGRAALAPLLRRSEILLLNFHEGRELTGLDGHPKQVLEALRALGPKTVVMTDGIRGSFAFDGRRFLRAGVFPMPVVDRTGAGDAYSASLIAAVHLGLPLEVAMAWGTVQAAHVVSVFGSTPGLLRRRRLQSTVGAHRELAATEF